MADQRLSLQQRLLQKLSPQQIQVIKLLEIPTIQLEQRIKSELEENPILELVEGENSEESYDDAGDTDDMPTGDEFSLEDYLNDEDVPNYRLNANNYSKDDKQVEMPYSSGLLKSLCFYLTAILFIYYVTMLLCYIVMTYLMRYYSTVR